MTSIIKPLYWLGKTVTKILCMLLGKWRVHDPDNVPAEGGVLIAANHSSFLDPPVVGAGLKRNCYFMGKKELFTVPIFGWIIRHVGCFPVDRGGQDRKAVKFAIGLLKDGKPLVVFPEGGRTKDGELQAAGIGAALIANRGGAPIVPAYIRGTYESHRVGSKLPRRADISVRYAEPIPSTGPDGGKLNKDELQELTDRVMAEIGRMKAEADEAETEHE